MRLLLRPLQLLLAACLLLLQVASARADDARPAIEEQDPLAPRSTSDLALLVGRVAEAQAETARQIEALTSLEDRQRTLEREDELLSAFGAHLSTQAEALFFHGRLATIEDRLTAQRARLESLMDTVSEDLDRLGSERDRWRALESSWGWQALGELISRDAQRDLAPDLRSVRATIRATKASLEQAIGTLLEFQSRALAVTSRARALAQQVAERRAALRSDWLSRVSPPIWAQGEDPGPGPSWDRLLEVDARFVRRARDTLIRHAALLVLVFVGARRLAKAPGATHAQGLLQRPLSLALFLSTLVMGAAYQPSPLGIDALRWLVLGVTGARLGWVAFTPLGLPRVGLVLAVGEPAVRFVEVIGLPTVALRWIVVTCALAIAVLLVVRRHRLESSRRWWRTALSLGAALFMLAAIAEALGFAALGRSVFGATLDTGFFVVVFVLAHRLARGFADGVGSIIVPWVTQRWRETIEHWARALGWALQIAVFIRVALHVSFAWQITPPADATWKVLTNASITALDFEIPLAKVALAALALYVARQVVRVVELGLDSTFARRPGIDVGTGNSIKTIVRYSLLAVGVVLALATLGIELQNVAIVAGALGIGIGFGLQSVVADFTSGLILLFEQSLRTGDSLIIDEKWGTVSRIGLRSTVITMLDQSELIVPNSMLTSEKLQNWTLSTKQARVFCQVGIAYGSNVELAFEILERIAAEDPEVLDDPPPEVLFMEFADSALNLELRVWVDKSVLRLHARSRILRAIDTEFRKHGIVIAFPQRDVHLHLADTAKS